MKYSLIASLLILILPPAWGQTPEEHGLQIAQEADRRDTGFNDLPPT